MIICSNCGTTNNELNGRVCRKCGALLPISSRPPRIKMTSKKTEKQHAKKQRAPPKKKEPKKKSVAKPEILDLHEIPKLEEELDENHLEDDTESELSNARDGDEILREITPQPFRGSIIAKKGVFGLPQQTKMSADSDSIS